MAIYRIWNCRDWVNSTPPLLRNYFKTKGQFKICVTNNSFKYVFFCLLISEMDDINPFTADPVKALHFAIPV